MGVGALGHRHDRIDGRVCPALRIVAFFSHALDRQVEFLAAAELLKPVSQDPTDAHRFQVPVHHLAEPDNRLGLAFLLDEVVELFEQQFQPLVDSRCGVPVPGAFPLHQLPEDPRIGEGSTPDRNAIAAGLCEHLGSLFDVENISITDHRDRIDRIDDRSDSIEVDGTREALFTGSAVDRNGGDPDLLEGSSQVRSGQ